MSVMEQQPATTRRRYTDEYKRDAVATVLDDGFKIVDVANRPSVNAGTLGNWVRQERTDRGERTGLTTSEKAELAELSKENARLRMERDLLKRAGRYVGDPPVRSRCR